MTAPSVAVRNNLNAGAVSYVGAISLQGGLITDDLNFAAAQPILVAGDSVCAGTGASRTAAMYPAIVRDWFNARGGDCQIVLRAKSGSNLAEHASWWTAGWHQPATRPRLGMYALGTNDAGAGVPPAAYGANIAVYWDWWRRNWPTAPLIVLGIPPPANPAAEANAAALRLAAPNFAAAADSPLLKFIDLGTAWAPTDATRTTDGVHPNDAGHAALANLIVAALQSQGIAPEN